MKILAKRVGLKIDNYYQELPVIDLMYDFIEDTEELVQDSLEAAMKASEALGDEVLTDQIGNTITFFTRKHVVASAD